MHVSSYVYICNVPCYSLPYTTLYYVSYTLYIILYTLYIHYILKHTPHTGDVNNVFVEEPFKIQEIGFRASLIEGQNYDPSSSVSSPADTKIGYIRVILDKNNKRNKKINNEKDEVPNPTYAIHAIDIHAWHPPTTTTTNTTTATTATKQTSKKSTNNSSSSSYQASEDAHCNVLYSSSSKDSKENLLAYGGSSGIVRLHVKNFKKDTIY